MSGEDTNYLDMSDEDMLNQLEPTTPAAAASPAAASAPAGETGADVTPPAQAGEAAAADTDEEDDAEDKGAAAAPPSPTPAPAAKGTEAPAGAAAPQPAGEVPAGGAASSTAAPAAQAPAAAPADTPASAPAIDYKAEYERLLAPFKANGREIQPRSVADAVALMQMGANYNKKMAALKPGLRVLKMLETNGLLDEEKISFLIDVHGKNPDAINKLVKDSGLNPMELDPEKAAAYKPTVRTVDEREMALDAVLDEIQGTPSYSKTLDVVSKQWDTRSKQTIADTPQVLRVLNDHMERGIYDLIASEVERERMLGRLAGMSDLEAYRQVGDAINARGGFNHLAAAAPAPVAPKPAVSVTPPSPAPSPTEADLNEKRRAASPTRAAAAPAAPAADFNPLSLSDAEFEKMAIAKFK